MELETIFTLLVLLQL